MVALFGSTIPTSKPNPKLINYTALLIFVVCTYSIFSFLRSVRQQLLYTQAEYESAIATIRQRDEEARSFKAEIENLKSNHFSETSDFQSQVDKLNDSLTSRTGKNFKGYAQFPNGKPDGLDDLVVVIKTGATEIDHTLPIQLLTILSRNDNFLIFSDNAQPFAGGLVNVQDALDSVSPDLLTSTDFRLYSAQKTATELGQNPAFMKMKGGSELDKYKGLPILVKTYAQKPDAKWYLFVDADSYPVLTNILPYLATLDPTQSHYIGSAAYVDDAPFAHGGPGYVVSAGAMKLVLGSLEEGDTSEAENKTEGENTQTDKRIEWARGYEPMQKDSCCGDLVVAKSLKDKGVELSSMNPRFQGDPMYLVKFSGDMWCKEIMSLHHMRPEDIGRLWAWESEKAEPKRKLLFEDVFNDFLWPVLEMSEEVNGIRKIEGWNNMGDDDGERVELPLGTLEPPSTGPTKSDKVKREVQAVRGSQRMAEPKSDLVWKACEKKCREDTACMQFRVWKKECKINKNLVLGWKAPEDDDESAKDFRSGWMRDRVEDLRKKGPCEQPRG